MPDSIPFCGFDDRREVKIYHNGLLPHWRQEHCTYFVTFRLADSLPAPVVREMEYERDQWLLRHGIDSQAADWRSLLAQQPFEQRRHFERRTSALLEKHLDAGYGNCAMRDPCIAQKVAAAITHFHGTRLWVGDFVVMPNHVHALMRPFCSHELETILHSIKSFTANQINGLLGRTGRFWQRESYDHIVRDLDQLIAFQRYIAANSAKANLRNEQFIYHGATWHLDE
jgi:REP element-mobilizing transposase RayT